MWHSFHCSNLLFAWMNLQLEIIHKLKTNPKKHENFEVGLLNKNNKIRLHNMKFSSFEASEVASHEFFPKTKF